MIHILFLFFLAPMCQTDSSFTVKLIAIDRYKLTFVNEQKDTIYFYTIGKKYELGKQYRIVPGKKKRDIEGNLATKAQIKAL